MDMVFGAGLGRTASHAELVAAATSAEAAGFSVVTVADHLGSPSPFTRLGLVAAVTSTVRLRTYVLDAYFWNAALLAREVATIDSLSGGRFELGLGAGHMKHEHLDAGLPFPSISSRVEHLGSLLSDVQARLSSDSYAPAPVQRPVPVVLGVWGAAGLALAARAADVVGLSGLLQVRGAPAGTFGVASSADTDAKVAELRALLPLSAPSAPSALSASSASSAPSAPSATSASSAPSAPSSSTAPSPVIDALLQHVSVSGSPVDAAAAVLEGEEGVTVEELLDSPFFLFASSPAEAAEELLRRRDRWGITSWCTHAASVPALAEVVRELRS